MSDLLHEGLTVDQIALVFATMAEADWHEFQVLTKRAERLPQIIQQIKGRIAMAWETFDGGRFLWPLPNVWLGVSVEDQKTADERIPLLLETPAAVRFVSYEPALGPVDFSRFIFPDVVEEGHELDWIIVGGESGPGARPFDIAWARNTVTQCRESGVACFVKQLGSMPLDPHVKCAIECGCGLHYGFRDRKGGDWDEWPADIRVRRFPAARTL
jgi:protein gp37